MSCNIRTSKKWVLPPKPRPGRKPTDKQDEKPMINHSMSAQELTSNIAIIASENQQLKTHLLSLIYDYKNLKHLVLDRSPSSSPVPLHLVSSTERRKRSFTELNHSDPMNKLISDMNDLSHNTPSLSPAEPDTPIEPVDNMEYSDTEIDQEVFSFINLDILDQRKTFPIDEESEPDSEVEDDENESPSLSRTTSPSTFSENEENSLMTTLTRSTTVSTNNSFFQDRKVKPGNSAVKFYDLPSFTPSDYNFTFENIDQSANLMSIIQEDKYNMVTDFLEEKLIDNDLNYYVQNERLG